MFDDIPTHPLYNEKGTWTADEYAEAFQLTEKDRRLLAQQFPDEWAEPVFHDTAELLDADPNETLATSFLTRSDGVNAIYPGCHTAIYGEPGSGKTMLAKYATYQALREGYKVAHIDIDDNRKEIVAHDVLKFGATRPEMIARWKLAQPDSLSGLNDLWERLVADKFDLVIIDSMASLEGLTGTDANGSLDFVQRVYLPFVKRLMTAEIAVISTSL